MLTLDWIIIALFFTISLGIGIYMSKRAGKSTSDFFLSGRNLPWYIAGTSMVATTFAADTPLAVTELVAESGIAGNWLWWNMLFGGMLTVFFFARLWRRADILTDCELVSIRYSGASARFLRGFRALYIGVVMNVVVLAWVNLAMVKILWVMFPDITFFGHSSISFLGIEFSAHLLLVGMLLLFVSLYSSLSGLWGISLTDSFQFVIAMVGCIALAIFALRHPDVGGMAGLKAKLPESVFSFFPTVSSKSDSSGTQMLTLSLTAFITYLGVQWWASWYPGAEPGGGGYVAQRMMSAKNEKHSLLATLWFQVAHVALRPWPWIIVALVTLVLYPDAADKGATYIMVVKDIMPTGWLGLLLAAFLAAFMSTIASQIVWGTSYIVNDFVKPFIKPNATEKYYVKVSRITTFVLMLLSLVVTTQFSKISDAWRFVLACSGGIGLVLILRWFWWRINAWSEISAMLAPFLVYPWLKLYTDLEFEPMLLITVFVATAVWILVTYLTKPTDEQTLTSFYRRIHPGGIGWARIAKKNPDIVGDSGYKYLWYSWFGGCITILSVLFATGKVLLGEYIYAIVLFAIALLGIRIIIVSLRKHGWEKIVN
ncbi:MAG: Na+:solute symporter [Bacteroidales bacterium]|nr:Na+:solute symporter [Bacteroidales bacterium]MDD4671696.1 Na+:solute symporter [Bacteroidales bacterium]MDY0348385.1 sodium:solute symporter family protein [Tenuifilaceae bacterium]